MSGANWVQLAVLIAAIVDATRLLGAYLARVFATARPPAIASSGRSSG